MLNRQTLEEKRAHYIEVISRRSPPQTSADQFMLEAYQALLDDVEKQMSVTDAELN